MDETEDIREREREREREGERGIGRYNTYLPYPASGELLGGGTWRASGPSVGPVGR